MARYASLPLAVLLLALLVIRPGIAALRGLTVAAGGARAAGPPTVAELQARLGAGDMALAQGLSPLRRKLIEAAQEDPRAAALVIKGWLDGDRDRS